MAEITTPFLWNTETVQINTVKRKKTNVSKQNRCFLINDKDIMQWNKYTNSLFMNVQIVKRICNLMKTETLNE